MIGFSCITKFPSEMILLPNNLKPKNENFTQPKENSHKSLHVNPKSSYPPTIYMESL